MIMNQIIEKLTEAQKYAISIRPVQQSSEENKLKDLEITIFFKKDCL